MENIKKLACYFIRRFPRRLLKTEIVKLLYCSDYYFYQLFGKQYTEAHYIRDNYGPYDAQIADAVNNIGDFIACNSYINIYGTTSYEYYITNEVEAEKYIETLPPQIRFIADYLIDRLKKGTRYHDILAFTYQTAPMVAILNEEKANGCGELFGRCINMSESKPIFKISKEERLAAKKRLQQVKPKGSDEDYYAHLIKEFSATEPLRRKVNSVFFSV